MQTNLGKISVIVPIYRVEKYLDTCIGSLIGQTYGNLEILLVNDGSPDRCGEICEAYAARDGRIRVLHRVNGGPSAARNTGLDAATGDFIGFVDPDDYVHERFYETLMRMIRETDADIAQCRFRKVSEDDLPGEWQEMHDGSVSVLERPASLHNLYTNDIHYIHAVVVWNKLYKKELFDGIRFPEGKIHEDEHIAYKVLYRARRVALTSDPLYGYLQRPDSYMGSRFNLKRLEVLDAYSEQIRFFRDHRLPDLEQKAKINLEGSIRALMIKAMYSGMENREDAFRYLVSYYRQQYGLFAPGVQSAAWKKVLMRLFRYSPLEVLKLLIRLKYYKSLMHARRPWKTQGG